MRETLRVGTPTFIASDSPEESYSTVFEDDGATGYFYAYDRRTGDGQILDALHIYNVSAVVDRQSGSVADIVWSDDGLKSALLINGYPHAVVDFVLKRGYCRNDFPNFRPAAQGNWETSTHEWDDAVMEQFRTPG
jgi:hypothetical protein